MYRRGYARVRLLVGRLDADQLLVGGSPGGLGDGEEVDRLEQVALALPVIAVNEGYARLEIEVQADVVAKVDQAQVRDVDGTTSRDA